MEKGYSKKYSVFYIVIKYFGMVVRDDIYLQEHFKLNVKDFFQTPKRSLALPSNEDFF